MSPGRRRAQLRFFIGSTEPEVPLSAKLELVRAFVQVTDALLWLTLEWTRHRVVMERPASCSGDSTRLIIVLVALASFMRSKR